MRSAFRRMDAAAIKFATSMRRLHAEEAIAEVEAFRADAEFERRQAVSECKTCFYLRGGGRVAGQAFTQWNCGVCGTERTHANTGTPKVCINCATAHRLCTHCGGDVDMRENRRKFPEPVATPVPEGGTDAG